MGHSTELNLEEDPSPQTVHHYTMASAGGREHLGDRNVMKVSEVKEVASLERRRGLCN